MEKHSIEEIVPLKARVVVRKVVLESLVEPIIILPQSADPWLYQRTVRVLKVGSWVADVPADDPDRIESGDIVVIGREGGIVETWQQGQMIMIESKYVVAKVDTSGKRVVDWEKGLGLYSSRLVL